MEIVFLFVAGAFGALAKDVVIDNRIQLPKIIDGSLGLGFIGAMLVGGFVGWAIDGSFITAALAGFAGLSAIENLLLKRPTLKIE